MDPFLELEINPVTNSFLKRETKLFIKGAVCNVDS